MLTFIKKKKRKKQKQNDTINDVIVPASSSNKYRRKDAFSVYSFAKLCRSLPASPFGQTVVPVGTLLKENKTFLQITLQTLRSRHTLGILSLSKNDGSN